jgi:hypothetical protein
MAVHSDHFPFSIFNFPFPVGAGMGALRGRAPVEGVSVGLKPGAEGETSPT